MLHYSPAWLPEMHPYSLFAGSSLEEGKIKSVLLPSSKFFLGSQLLFCCPDFVTWLLLLGGAKRGAPREGSFYAGHVMPRGWTESCCSGGWGK